MEFLEARAIIKELAVDWYDMSYDLHDKIIFDEPQIVCGACINRDKWVREPTWEEVICKLRLLAPKPILEGAP